MGISDADSILHLLKSISPWGMLFIIIFILPLYLGLWTAVLKLLSVPNIQNPRMLVVVFAVFAIALILLKIGVDRDKEKKLLGDRVKNYMISYGFKGIEFNRLVKDAMPGVAQNKFEDLIERFPEDFTLTYFLQADSQPKKGILLTNEISLKKIDSLHERILPIAYTVVDHLLPRDSTASVEDVYRIDDRFNFEVVEMLGYRYPQSFTLISSHDQNKLLLKKIR